MSMSLLSCRVFVSLSHLMSVFWLSVFVFFVVLFVRFGKVKRLEHVSGGVETVQAAGTNTTTSVLQKDRMSIAIATAANPIQYVRCMD